MKTILHITQSLSLTLYIRLCTNFICAISAFDLVLFCTHNIFPIILKKINDGMWFTEEKKSCLPLLQITRK